MPRQPAAVNAGAPETMNRTAELAARLADLQIRSEATDRAAAAALEELTAAGMELAAALDRLAAAAARQRASRARRSQPRPVVACECCGREWVPVRQGRYCSRQCVERAGHLRRLLQADPVWRQRERLAGWLAAAGPRVRGPRQGLRGLQAALAGDSAERRRLLEGHRHLLEPEMEVELVQLGWLWGPEPGRLEHTAAALLAAAAAG